MADFGKDFTTINIGGSPKERLDTAASDETDLWANLPKRYMILAIPWLYAVIGLIVAMATNYNIARRERIVTGTIIAYQPDNRHTSVYTFSIGNKVYTGQERGSDHKASGEQVVVYYDPADPEKNRLEDFGEEAVGLLGPLSFILILSGTGIFFVLNQRRESVRREIFWETQHPEHD